MSIAGPARAGGGTVERRPAPLWPPVALGLGLGGFVDGIVLHQILQWHHMLSAYVPPADVGTLRLNVLADGLFHAFAWIATAVGVAGVAALARRGVRWSAARLLGGLAIGWGVFNLVEGVVDHHLLGIHHVRPGPDQLAWDLGFLAFGALLVIGGVLLAREGREAAAERAWRRAA